MPHTPFTDAEQARLRALGLRIKVLRVGRELTQEELAREAKLTATLLGAVERGERNVGVLAFWPIADALGVPIADLFHHHTQHTNPRKRARPHTTPAPPE